MLAKMTSKNQITLPKALTKTLGDVQYFESNAPEAGSIVLTPVRLNRADAVRSRLAAMGLSEKDVAEARKLGSQGPLTMPACAATRRPAARRLRHQTSSFQPCCLLADV